MKSKRYRRKRRLNVMRLFVVTVMLLVFLGFVITQRNRNLDAVGGGQNQKVSETDESRDNEAVMKQIFADETRYP